MKKISFALALFAAAANQNVIAQKSATAKGASVAASPATTVADSLMKPLLNQVNFRMIGPATTSGRIVDIAVNPNNKS